MKAYFIKTVSRVMFFRAQSASRCVCFIRDGIGYDAIGESYNVTTDDHGNIVFVKYQHVWVK